MRCAVLGGGSWGTALAVALVRNGHEVFLWDRNRDRCEVMNREHRNARYLVTETLPVALKAHWDLETVLSGAELVVPVLPSHALREVMTRAVPFISKRSAICCASKGIENGTLATMHDVLMDTLGGESRCRVSMLYGPSFALEVVKGLPTAVAVAGPDSTAHIAAEAFHSSTFRAYHTDDVIGVCVGGSLKNVMAIACGVSDGLNLGNNTRAGLITRGLNEITRLAVAMGANPITLMGLSGMGDLVLTCTGGLSRNRRVGLGLGKGKKLPEILDELGEVAEGVYTAKSAWALSQKLGVEMPITEQIYDVLYNDKDVYSAITTLLMRERRGEWG